MISTLQQTGLEIRNWWSVRTELEAGWHREETAGWPYAKVFREHLVSWNLLDTSMAYANNEMILPVD